MSRAFIQKRLPFKPTDIGGCQLWLDASQDTTTSGSYITTLPDRSGNVVSVAPSVVNTITLAGNTLNGLPVYNFGSNSAGCDNFNWATTFTQFVVAKCVSGKWLSSLWNTNNSQYQNYVFTSNFNLEMLGNFSFSVLDSVMAQGTSILSTTPGGVSSWFIFCIGYLSGSTQGSNYSLNGTVRTTSAGAAFSGTSPIGKFVLNGNGGGSVLDSSYVAEFIHFNSNLSETQRQQVESYLAQKWGLRQQLPQGHPGTRGIVYPAAPVNVLFKVPYSSVFSPSAVGTVSMWLDGADPAGTGTPPSNGSTVSTWVDKSGSGINLTAVGTPTYVTASSSVYLNGSSYLQNTNFNFTNYTLFIVSNQASSDGPLYTNNTTTAGYSGFFPRYGNGSYYLVQSDTAWLSGGSPFSDGTTYIYSIQYDSLNNINLWSNGSISPVITGTAGTITRNKFLLGKRSVSIFSENMTGNVFEVVQYNSDLGQTSRQKIEGYLAWKWGLQASLPGSHPYKNGSPNITNQFGISRPANVLPIPPITIYALPRPTFPYTNTFIYTAGIQQFQVPSTISPAKVTVYMWGAGAGGNTNYGGAGAMVQGVLTVIPGETLNIVVGQGGTIDGLTTFGGGGAGGGNFTGTSPAVGIGYSFNGYPQNAGSGGGRSAIQRPGTDPVNDIPLNDIVVAGGGGGGSYFSSDHGGAATFSGTANSGTGGLPGLGGTQSAGGAGGGVGTYGTGLSGSRGVGGNTYNNNIYNGAGGGGGGYYGGGGGGTNGGDGAGGGGGSSLTDGLSLISGQTVKGFNSTNGYTAPNTGSPYYQSGIGNGAPSVNSSPRAGGNGLVVITYNA